jgi:hypothetical protein
MSQPESRRRRPSGTQHDSAPTGQEPGNRDVRGQRQSSLRLRRPHALDPDAAQSSGIATARPTADPAASPGRGRELDPDAAPSSRATDSERWVAAMPFTAEELEDTWPNLAPPYDDD